MKTNVLYTLLLCLFLSSKVIYAADAAAEEKPLNAFDLIGDGKRLTLRDGQLSIPTLPGWEVHTTIPGLTLLMRAPVDASLRFQRTIQIASFSGLRLMDEITAKEFESLIMRKFSASNASIENYHIRNHVPITLEDGRQGLLFYSDFRIDDIDLMQAHILVSTTSNHFLVTYTDLASHFEGDGQGPYLNEAWSAMNALQLSGESPVGFQSSKWLFTGLGVVALGLGIFIVFRYVRHKRKLDQQLKNASKDDPELDIQEEDKPTWTLPDAKKLRDDHKEIDEDDLLSEDEAS